MSRSSKRVIPPPEENDVPTVQDAVQSTGRERRNTLQSVQLAAVQGADCFETSAPAKCSPFAKNEDLMKDMVHQGQERKASVCVRRSSHPKKGQRAQRSKNSIGSAPITPSPPVKKFSRMRNSDSFREFEREKRVQSAQLFHGANSLKWLTRVESYARHDLTTLELTSLQQMHNYFKESIDPHNPFSLEYTGPAEVAPTWDDLTADEHSLYRELQQEIQAQRNLRRMSYIMQYDLLPREEGEQRDTLCVEESDAWRNLMKFGKVARAGIYMRGEYVERMFNLLKRERLNRRDIYRVQALQWKDLLSREVYGEAEVLHRWASGQGTTAFKSRAKGSHAALNQPMTFRSCPMKNPLHCPFFAVKEFTVGHEHFCKQQSASELRLLPLPDCMPSYLI